jgi:hypothetical protein
MPAVVIVEGGMEDIQVDLEIPDMAKDEGGSTRGLDRLIRIRETLIVSSTRNQTLFQGVDGTLKMRNDLQRNEGVDLRRETAPDLDRLRELHPDVEGGPTRVQLRLPDDQSLKMDRLLLLPLGEDLCDVTAQEAGHDRSPDRSHPRGTGGLPLWSENLSPRQTREER